MHITAPTQLLKTSFGIFVALCACGLIDATASNVTLQQATATFSQTYGGDFSSAKAIDGAIADNGGWALSPSGGPNPSDQIAVFETASDIGFAGGSVLTFSLIQSYDGDSRYWYHTLGRFRLSVTTDDRSLFADGLATGGDVTANWTVLDPDSFTSANGATLSELLDHSILASGLSPTKDVYTVTASTLLTGITGVRLEALKDPSLPYNGPGRKSENGNFVLSEFQMSITPMTNCVPSPSGLVSWWRGEGDANDVVSANNGTLTGGVTFVGGKVGQAFSFDGTDEAGISDSPDLNVQTFTIDAWVFPTLLDGEMETILYKEREGGPEQYALAIKGPANVSCAGTIPTGHFAFAILGISGMPGGEFCGWVDGGGSVPTNEWTHLAVTFDGNSAKAYINGVMTRNITNLSGSVNVSDGPLKIGSRSLTAINLLPNDRFNGRIDEVDLFNRVLSSGEIQGIFHAGSAGKCPPIAPPVVPFTNGSFELPMLAAGSGQALPPGSTAITGWTVGSVGGMGWQNGTVNGVNPVDGAQHIGFNVGNASPGSSIFQMFNTTVGQTYTVSFSVGRSGPGGGTMSLLAEAKSSTGGVLGSWTAVAPNTQSYGSIQTFVFTATTTNSTLTFTDTSLATVAVDVLLDNVSVTPSSGSCVTPPSGLVNWWPGEGNANDSAAGANGTLQNGATFAAGKVGQSFSFDGVNDSVSFGNTAGNFGTNDFAIEFWIRSTASTYESVIEKWPVCDNASAWLIRIRGPGPWGAAGRVEAAIISDAAGNDVNSIFSERVVNDGVFHHVALVRQSTTLSLYIDGTFEVMGLTPGITRISNTANLVAGRSVCTGIDGTQPSAGQLDEISIYSRALSATEIQSIYNASSAGKCGLPPTILAQPQDRTVAAGEDATFTVAASGSPPLNYQWRFGEANINGATNSSFTVSNVQPGNTGNYSVVVSNPYGIPATSSDALLTVTAPPVCVPVPSGLVNWWPGEGNADDSADAANGTLQNGATFAAGKLGQAFSFDGVNDSVSFGNTAGNFGTNDFAIEFWIRSTASTYESVIEKWPVCDNASAWLIRIRGPGPWGAAGRVEAAIISDAAGNDVNSIFSERVVNDGVFHHVALVRQSTTLSLYIDGTFEVMGLTPGITRISNTANLVAGRSVCTGIDGTQPSAGQLDEISIYSRALSATKIQSIYNAGSAGKCPPLPVGPFTNGSFELPVLATGSSVDLPAGSTTLTGWVVGNTGLVSWRNGPAYGVAPIDGSQEIGFNGADTPPGGSISQTFTTLIGQTYEVRFNVGRQGPGGGTMRLLAAVTSGTGADLGSLNAVAPGSPGYGGAQIFSFTATTSTSTLTFTDTSSATIAVDVLLDNVSVIPSSSPPVGPFTNGSFESPVLAAGSGQSLPPGSTAITGWTVGSMAGIGWKNGDAFGVNPVDGTQHIGFNGANTSPGSSIFQTFSTTVGQTYAVSFYVGRTGAGGGTMSLLAAVSSSSGAVLGSLNAIAPGSPGYGDVQMFSFTATTTSSTLTFMDTSSATVDVDPLLDNVVVEVITPAQSVGLLILMVDQLNLPRNCQRPLIATLKVTAASFEDGNMQPGMHQLGAFQNKVRAQVAPLDQALADSLIGAAQEIIDALNGP